MKNFTSIVREILKLDEKVRNILSKPNYKK